MKLMQVTSLQHPTPDQTRLTLGKDITKMMKCMGWNEETKIFVFRHGAGFFFCAYAGRQAQEFEATLSKSMQGKEEKSAKEEKETPKKGANDA